MRVRITLLKPRRGRGHAERIHRGGAGEAVSIEKHESLG
jgi:hypothetical protein